MIKLIATDMDGTLLDEHGIIPKEFFQVFNKLKENNIKFIVASGRPYYTLYENFSPISDELTYICDNGAMVVDKGEIISISKMNSNYINEIISECEKLEKVHIILCGVNSCYHKPCSIEALTEINKYYIKKNVVEDFSHIDDIIFKVTVLDLGLALKNSYPILNPIFGEKLNCVVSGDVWVDFTNKGTNKGEALKKVQLQNSISFEETMAFGDFFNDVELLQNAYYSFVMDNACDEMKKHGRFIAKKNTENGVIQAIKEYTNI
ncbi:MAG: Cof-type HAD-IIB family hydrolase [Clostridium sp.]|uniref:Cof-type HAD-IIB family hydrolase n=1 Tax=Clostridium sp. TaxID=1506 RepID=UPI003F3DCF61